VWYTVDDDAVAVFDARDVTSPAEDDGCLAGAVVDHDLGRRNAGARLDRHSLHLATCLRAKTRLEFAQGCETQLLETVDQTLGVDLTDRLAC